MFFDVYSKLCASIGKAPNTVARELGFPSSSVTQWKHGSTPRPAALQKIADYFGVSVHYLLGAEQKEKSSTPFGAELSETKLAFIQKVILIDDDIVDALNKIADEILSQRGK